MRLSRLIVASVLSLAALGTAHSIEPVDGWFWDPARGGMGFNLSTARNPAGELFMFGSVFAGTQSGEPTFYTLSGVYDEHSMAEWRASGETFVGSLESPLYRTTNSPCVDGSCALGAATTVASDYSVILEFRDPRRVRATISNSGVAEVLELQYFDIETNIAGSGEDFGGEWRFFRNGDSDTLHSIAFEPTNGPFVAGEFGHHGDLEGVTFFRGEDTLSEDWAVAYSPETGFLMETLFEGMASGRRYQLFVGTDSAIAWELSSPTGMPVPRDDVVTLIRERPLPDFDYSEILVSRCKLVRQSYLSQWDQVCEELGRTLYRNYPELKP